MDSKYFWGTYQKKKKVFLGNMNFKYYLVESFWCCDHDDFVQSTRVTSCQLDNVCEATVEVVIDLIDTHVKPERQTEQPVGSNVCSVCTATNQANPHLLSTSADTGSLILPPIRPKKKLVILYEIRMCVRYEVWKDKDSTVKRERPSKPWKHVNIS